MTRKNIFRFRQFMSDESGTIAILFGMTILGVMIAVGLAVDGARAYHLASKQAAILDAAALAAAKAMKEDGASDSQVRAIAESYIAANSYGAASSGYVLGEPQIAIDRVNDTVSISMASQSKNHIGAIIGMNAFAVERSASAVFSVKDIEMGLMLDVSSSMGSYNKLEDLKTAVKDMIDVLVTGDPNKPKVRIGFAPYSGSVNVGSFALQAKGPAGAAANSCVTERTLSTGAFTDEPPGPGRYMGDKASSCPPVTITPLSNDNATLKSTIDNYAIHYKTAGHLGAAWAWYLVSPNWSSIWPAASKPVSYTDKKTLKAVVLMTDGMFNTAYETDNGSSTTQALALCNKMKASGVIVFTIGFETPSAALPTLQTCASDTTKFYDAKNGTELHEAFNKIAGTLTDLRLAQ